MKTTIFEIKKVLKMSQTLCKTMEILSHPARLVIFSILQDKELSVSEIEKLSNIKQPTLSQQLTILKKNKLVSTRKEGKFIFYKSLDTKESALLQSIYRTYYNLS